MSRSIVESRIRIKGVDGTKESVASGVDLHSTQTILYSGLRRTEGCVTEAPLMD